MNNEAGTSCHTDHDHHDCHSHGGKETVILYFVGLVIFIVALFLSTGLLKNVLFSATLVLSGYHVIFDGFSDTWKQTIRRKKFHPNVHILMTLAALGAMVIGEFMEAALLILIFAGAHYLEDYAQGKSKREITSLLNLNPTTARKIMPNGEIEIVDVGELELGDQLSILNGDQIPTDGIVVSGNSAIDQSAITGESIPVEKTVGDALFGSTINGRGTLVMEVSKDSSDTVFAKIVELVSQTQSNVSRTAALIRRIEPVYVTVVLLLTPIFYFIGLYLLNWTANESFYRTMVFLIATSPCALAATDIPASLSAISNLAKRGVLFKGASYLSHVADLNAVAFDKTGTLTSGKPAVTEVYFTEGVTEQEQVQLVEIIVSMESKANHPLADAILKHYERVVAREMEVENVIGVGLVADVDGVTYTIGKPSSTNDVPADIKQETKRLEEEGKTVVYFGTREEVLGLIGIQDLAKDSSQAAVSYFKNQAIHTVMITGDAVRTGEAIGRELKIDEVRGNVMPEEKASIISELKEKYPVTAMLGDGVNDAPALVTADIGVAMGEGTDIAIDVADAVLMKNDLTKFAYTHRLAKKLRRVVWQNIFIAMSVVLILIVTNLIGYMSMSFAVVIHEGSTLVVILNGLRMLKGMDETVDRGITG